MADFINTCAALAPLYKQGFLDPLKTRHPGFATDPWESLAFFLEGYAFAWPGSSPEYPSIAVASLAETWGQSFSGRSAQKAWKRFRKELGEKGPNYSHNPMCPQGTTYQRRYKGKSRTSTTRGLSAIQLVRDELNNCCLVDWARGLIAGGEASMAHAVLKRVNGVDQKIASLFLRDLAVMYDIRPEADRWLLLPVDRWIRFVVRQQANDEALSVRDCAEQLMAVTDQPEEADQGIWYFCTQIARSSEFVVRRACAESELRERLMDEHLQRCSRVGQAAQTLTSRLHGDQQG